MARKHVLVLGSGVAGLTTALSAADAGWDVTVLSKSRLDESNTRYAQGGVAVVTAAPDTVESHVADTLEAGAGISYVPTVEALCAEGPGAVERLIERGVEFDRNDGELARGLEAAHSHARILHAGGDATGAAIAYGLLESLKASGVTVRENTMAVDLAVQNGRVVGVKLLDDETVLADAVVLATGGAGQLFPYTTNPTVATADGLAMALRAGAIASDLEFYQFHPTSLAAPGNSLISEAVRGEGAVLLNGAGERFMVALHPDAELAPRDIVARAVAETMAAQGGVPVRLDATAFGAEFLAKRFPNIDKAIRDHGFDWSIEPIPITPAAHYFMGGVRTDAWGRTSLPGLFAVGEVACNGLHGANRLASNSLLEGAVFGDRVVAALDDQFAPVFDEQWGAPIVLPPASSSGQVVNRTDLQHLMWDVAGLVRDQTGLAKAKAILGSWSAPEQLDPKSVEDGNLLTVARAMVASALARRSSRGGHHRIDFPETLPSLAHHSGVQILTEAN